MLVKVRRIVTTAAMIFIIGIANVAHSATDSTNDALSLFIMKIYSYVLENENSNNKFINNIHSNAKIYEKYAKNNRENSISQKCFGMYQSQISVSAGYICNESDIYTDKEWVLDIFEMIYSKTTGPSAYKAFLEGIIVMPALKFYNLNHERLNKSGYTRNAPDDVVLFMLRYYNDDKSITLDNYTKEQAFNALRNAGEYINDSGKTIISGDNILYWMSSNVVPTKK